MLRALRIRNYPEVFRWVRCAHMSTDQKDTGVIFREQHDMMMERKIGGMCFEVGEKGLQFYEYSKPPDAEKDKEINFPLESALLTPCH